MKERTARAWLLLFVGGNLLSIGLFYTVTVFSDSWSPPSAVDLGTTLALIVTGALMMGAGMFLWDRRGSAKRPGKESGRTRRAWTVGMAVALALSVGFWAYLGVVLPSTTVTVVQGNWALWQNGTLEGYVLDFSGTPGDCGVCVHDARPGSVLTWQLTIPNVSTHSFTVEQVSANAPFMITVQPTPPQPVLPGSSETFGVEVHLPSQPGTYEFVGNVSFA